MKRHQEILEIIGGVIGLGVLCFFAYKAYQVITEFPVFFGAVGGVILLWLLYNFRITAARISLYFNPKTSYNLLKNHLEKGRAVALKKYIFGKAVYHIYYKASKDEREKLNQDTEKAERYLTDALELLKERDEKVKITLKEDKEKLDKIGKKIADRMNKKSKENIKWFFIVKVILKQIFSMLTIMFPMAFKVISIYFHYSFLKSPKVYYYRGAVHTVSKKYELALEDFEECLKENYEEKSSLYGKLCALYGLERYEEALGIVEAILEIDKKHNKAIYERGSIHYKQGNTEAACKDWKLAIEYGYKEDTEEKEKRKERCANF